MHGNSNVKASQDSACVETGEDVVMDGDESQVSVRAMQIGSAEFLNLPRDQ